MKAVFFDLDGTLFNTLGDITYAVNYALKAFDIEPSAPEAVRRYVGNGLRNALALAVAASGKRVEEEDFELMHQLLESAYKKHPADHTVLYDGIEELLSELHRKGILLGLLSNKTDSIVQALLSRYPLPLDYASGAVPGRPLKPDPELLLSAMESLGVRAEDTVYVGDSEVDRKTAENAGVSCLVVSYGFRTEDELRESGIERALGSVSELGKALLG